MTSRQQPLAGTLDRQVVIEWFHRNRRRSTELFDLLETGLYYARPIPLRHPVVFYEGHMPAFNVNTLLKKGLGSAGCDPSLEALFARGIDPDESTAAEQSAVSGWPARDVVRRFAGEADRAVLAALETGDLDRPGHPVLDRGQAVYTLLEHEALHHETLLYMWHRLPYAGKHRPPGVVPATGSDAPAPETVRVPAGTVKLGADPARVRFGWDNEFPCHRVAVDAFEVDRYDVTNHDYRRFVEAGGYDRPALWTPEAWAWRTTTGVEHPLFWERRAGAWIWRGMFEAVPLPPAWPVYVTHAEASAYARWQGARLLTEAEFHRAAYGTPEGGERDYPWGADQPDATRGNFDFRHWDPVPVGSYAAGRSAWGIDDLVGNGWEWTSTVFDGFPGFEPMASYPQYSADFFDGRHYVIKGASSATAVELIRPSFRNWFRSHYPYVYATFRCVRGAA